MSARPLGEALRALHHKYHGGCAAGFVDEFRPCPWNDLTTRADALTAERDALLRAVEAVRERCDRLSVPAAWIVLSPSRLVFAERAAYLAALDAALAPVEGENGGGP